MSTATLDQPAAEIASRSDTIPPAPYTDIPHGGWSVEADAFRSLLATVGPATRGKVIWRDLVRLTIEDGRLTAHADDTTMALVTSVPASEGPHTPASQRSAVVSYGTLLSLLKHLDGPVLCVPKGGGIGISAPRSGVDATVRGPVDVETAMAVRGLLPKDPVILRAADLSRALARVERFAAPPVSGQAALECVSIAQVDGRIELAAADGYRLAVASAGESISGSLPNPVLIPPAAARVLMKLLGRSNGGEVAMGRVGTRLVVEGDGWVWASSTIDGTFPTYRKVIPDDRPGTLLVNRAGLRVATDTASAVAASNDGFRFVRIAVAPGAEAWLPGTVTITGTDADLGEARRSVEAEVTGPADEFLIRSSYLRDLLDAGDADEIEIGYGNHEDQRLVFREPNGADVWLAMAMKPEKGDGA